MFRYETFPVLLAKHSSGNPKQQKIGSRCWIASFILSPILWYRKPSHFSHTINCQKKNKPFTLANQRIFATSCG